MEKKFKYTLKLKGKKEICPDCHKKTYVRFEDYQGNMLPDKYGRCDREDRCGYFLSPYHDGFGTGEFDPAFVSYKNTSQPNIPTSYMDIRITEQSLAKSPDTNLSRFLKSIIDPETVDLVFNLYYVGGFNSEWSVFWYIDIKGRVRSGKYMKYKENGRRYKSHESDISVLWEHSLKGNSGDRYPGFNFSQCFFGEHLLLSNPGMKIGIVESEKSAIISTMFIPEYLWLACGSKNGLGKEKCKVLENRSVTLFPDLGATEEWRLKAKEMGFNISNRLEELSKKYKIESGLDLADVLIESNNLILK